MYLYYFEKRFLEIKLKRKVTGQLRVTMPRSGGGSVATSGPCVEEAGISVLRPHLLQLPLLFLM